MSAGDGAAGISVAGLFIFMFVVGAEALVEFTTEDMRVGVMVVGLALFLLGGLALWVVEP